MTLCRFTIHVLLNTQLLNKKGLLCACTHNLILGSTNGRHKGPVLFSIRYQLSKLMAKSVDVPPVPVQVQDDGFQPRNIYLKGTHPCPQGEELIEFCREEEGRSLANHSLAGDFFPFHPPCYSPCCGGPRCSPNTGYKSPHTPAMAPEVAMGVSIFPQIFFECLSQTSTELKKLPRTRHVFHTWK